MKKTRERLIDSALELFAAKGYEATSVHEICKNAKASKGAFYHYFDTKHKLFNILLQDWLDVLSSSVSAVIAENLPVPATIRRMANITGPAIEATRAAFPILVEHWRQGNMGCEFSIDIGNPYPHYRKIFRDLISKGIEEGSIRPDCDPDTSSRLLQTAAVGYMLSGWLSPETESWPELLAGGVEIILSTMEVKQ